MGIANNWALTRKVYAVKRLNCSLIDTMCTSNACIDAPACRICMETSTSAENPLMELGCNCRGNLGLAHKNCAIKWFRNKARGHAEGLACDERWTVKWWVPCEICAGYLNESIVQLTVMSCKSSLNNAPAQTASAPVTPRRGDIPMVNSPVERIQTADEPMETAEPETIRPSSLIPGGFPPAMLQTPVPAPVASAQTPVHPVQAQSGIQQFNAGGFCSTGNSSPVVPRRSTRRQGHNRRSNQSRCSRANLYDSNGVHFGLGLI